MKKNLIKNLMLSVLSLLLILNIIGFVSAATFSTITWSNTNGAANSALTEIGAYVKNSSGLIKYPYAKGTNVKGQSGVITINVDVTKMGQYTCYTYPSHPAACYYSDSSLNGGVNHVKITSTGENSMKIAWEDSYWHFDFNDLYETLSWDVYTIQCSSNFDCNDNNARTEDICNNPGSSSSTCSHNAIRCLSNADCGVDGFIGNTFCQGNGIFQNYNSFICSNPGSASSFCSNNITAMLKTSCLSGQICSNAQCITTQCSNKIDDDLDGLVDSADPGCWNNIDDSNSYNPLLNNESKAGIQCFTNAQCGKDGFVGDKYCQNGNVYQDYKIFTCSNAGKGSSICSSNTSPRNVQTCALNNGCQNGQCIQFTCSSNSDCNDNDLYTVDVCNNPGTLSSNCSHSRINCVSDNDCGITGFFGVEFCSNNDVFKNFKTSRCINPGTVNSNCQVSSTATLLLDCGENSCDSYGINYCKADGNVYRQRVCNDKTCNSGACSSTFRAEENLVQTCSRGCINGQCRPDCTTNADCGSGKICQNNVCVQVTCSSNSDCNDNNANTEDICNNPGSSSSTCSHNNIACSGDVSCNDNNPSTQDLCMNPGTSQSVCHHMPISCSISSQCGTSGFSNLRFCQNGSVFDKYVTYVCNNPGTSSSSCSSSTEDRQISACISGCQDGQCIGAQCSSDSDCPRDYASLTRSCSNNSVHENFHDYSCSNSKCIDNTVLRLVETCDYKCRYGECRDKTNGTAGIIEESVETSPLVIINKDNSADNGNLFGSVSSDGINETALKLGRGYAIESDGNMWLLWLIGFIILLVLILIIVLIVLFLRN